MWKYDYLFTPCAPYIDCSDSNPDWGDRKSLWEVFEADPNILHPPVAEISDMKGDLGGPKLAIQYSYIYR